MERNFYRRTSSIESVVNAKNDSICFFYFTVYPPELKTLIERSMIRYEHQDRHHFSSINVTLGTRLYLLGSLVPKLQSWETFRTMVYNVLCFI